MIADTAKPSRSLTGVMMNYFHICHTELWYFSHDVEMEHTSDIVHLGRPLQAESHERDARFDRRMRWKFLLTRLRFGGLESWRDDIPEMKKVESS